MFRLGALRNPWLHAFLGCLVFAGVAVSLNLPSQIKLGEKGQAAIQMLDSMRRPFLDIKDTEVRLIKMGDAKSALRDFTKAVESGNTLIARYGQLAEYNPELSRRVTQLSETYEGWAAAEQHLFDHFLGSLPGETSPASKEHILEKLAIASSGFLSTMTVLGGGEEPIHADIDTGRRATHRLLLLSSTLFFYLMALIFLQQRAKTRLMQKTANDLELLVETRTADLREANKSLQQEIAERKLVQEALEKADKLKADFTAMIAHDLRSPLMNVVGAAEMIKDGAFGAVTEEQKTWLGKIEATSYNLVDLVSDFLDLSKLESGRIEVTKEEVDLDQLIRTSLDNFLVLAQDKKISLLSRVAPALTRIIADPRRLDQVFENLISNAIKFTGEGGEIEVEASQEDTTGIKIWVKDNGVGIPTKEIGNLFEKYRQTTSGKNSKNKGTGLGLVICKMIVEAHGGRIWVESEEGKGTTVAFSLPGAM